MISFLKTYVSRELNWPATYNDMFFYPTQPILGLHHSDLITTKTSTTHSVTHIRSVLRDGSHYALIEHIDE